MDFLILPTFSTNAEVTSSDLPLSLRPFRLLAIDRSD
ncbi:MAG: hypothetical protein JWQ02_527, partial [Capsulimonas sp.]|nr:hypothetical protein [Capsulimonas sp.]